MRRQSVGLSMAFTLMLAAAAFAQPFDAAQGGPGQGRGGGRGNPPQGPPPEGRGQAAPLDEKQQEALRALRNQAPSPAEQAALMQRLQRQLHELLSADAPDTAKIDALKKEIVTAQTNALNTRVSRQLQLAKILTPEQRRAMRQRGGPGPMGFGNGGRFGRGGGPQGPMGRGRGLGPMGRGGVGGRGLEGPRGRGFGFMGPGGGRGFVGPGPGGQAGFSFRGPGGRGVGPMRRRALRQQMRGGAWGPGFMRRWGPWAPREQEPLDQK